MNVGDFIGDFYQQITQQKQSSNTGAVLAPFSRASSTNTVTPSRRRTVTICFIVGTLYTDFKNSTVLFTIKLRTTDRPSPSLHRLSSASFVKEPTAQSPSKRHTFGT